MPHQTSFSFWDLSKTYLIVLGVRRLCLVPILIVVVLWYSPDLKFTFSISCSPGAMSNVYLLIYIFHLPSSHTVHDNTNSLWQSDIEHCDNLVGCVSCLWFNVIHGSFLPFVDIIKIWGTRNIDLCHFLKIFSFSNLDGKSIVSIYLVCCLEGEFIEQALEYCAYLIQLL